MWNEKRNLVVVGDVNTERIIDEVRAISNRRGLSMGCTFKRCLCSFFGVQLEVYVYQNTRIHHVPYTVKGFCAGQVH